MKFNKKSLIAGILSLSMMAILVVPALTLATTPDSDFDASDWELGTWRSTSGLGETELPKVISGIINIILSMLGVVAVLIILWGGFIWMTAGGEPDKVDKAKKLIISGIVGLAIIFTSYAIASFVLDAVRSSTGVSSI